MPTHPPLTRLKGAAACLRAAGLRVHAGPGKVRAFSTTPPYFDYDWTVHADMPEALRKELAQTFLALSRDTPEGREILEPQRATRFVPSQVDNCKGIEAAARSTGLL